jgi:WD40 repeat protein
VVTETNGVPVPGALAIIAGGARRPEWIPVTDGKHMDDKPQFSADGNTVYFTSTRDRFLCIWAQRLDPKSKHPVGPPFAYEHFHNAAGHASASFVNQSDLSVARANNGDVPLLLHNSGGNGNHFPNFKLVGTKSNRDAMGARIRVLAGGISQIREIAGGG